MARLNGFSDEQLSYTDFIDNFVDKQTVADASIDGNANVGTKDICSLTAEMSKPHSKLLAFNKVFHELNKRYGFKVANQWLENEWDGHFYLHDAASSTYVPYCFAYDLEGLVNKGLYFIENFNAQPPKHLETYTDFVGEFVSWTSNRSSGACGLPSFLIYSYYFWKEYPDGSFIIDYIDDIIEYQKAFMSIVSKVREQNMMTFPVLTYALLRKYGKFVDEDFAKWCCRHNMKWADSNFFISEDVTSLSNCCRLVSDVNKLGYFNSIGGSALEVGSIKVNTINLARIAYEHKNKDEYLKALRSLVKLDLQTLDAVRHIIARNAEKGLLPNYTHKIMNMSSQYNSIGIIGIYETLQSFGMTYKDEFGYTYYTDEGLEFAKEILRVINEEKDDFTADKDYQANIEQIPGERAASILMNKDKFFFPDETYELPLYGNQWIPLGVKTTIDEKVKLSAELDKACNGGSIAHINIDAPFNNFDTAWRLLNQIADAGVVYFAFCTRISACEHNHGFYGETCPICGSKKVTTYQRIVGFLTPEKTYSKERKQEFSMRDWMDLNRKNDLQ